MKTAIFLIVKNEKQYIKEWIEYHKNLGFDKILLYDNNDSESEDIYSEVEEYIKSGYIIYNDVKNKPQIQIEAYNMCIETYGKMYDWILFIDCDEFVDFNGNYTNVKDFLNSFDNETEQILIKWRHYTDNNLIYNDFRLVQERFKESIDKDVITEMSNCKAFIHTKILHPENVFKSAHFINTLYNTTYNADGIKIMPTLHLINEANNCIIKHYKTKTIEEYIERHRYDVSFPINVHRISIKLNNFFDICKYTEEKYNFIKNKYEWYTYFPSNQPVDVVICNNNIIKLTIISIREKLNWVNNIFVIDGNKSLENEFDNVYCISLKNIIPPEIKQEDEFDIGLFIHNIEGLSKRFIYVYSGTLFTYPCFEEEFFRNSRICMVPTTLNMIPNKFKLSCVKNSLLFLKDDIISSKEMRRRKDDFGYMFSHTCCPMYKEDNISCYNIMKKDILKCLRENKKINHLIYPTWSNIIGHIAEYMHSNVNINLCENPLMEIKDPIYKIINIF